jgi:dTDP-4-dehydrorhamnose 3,5-epimerase
MIFKHTSIAGAYVVELQPKEDDRGSFARSFCRREFSAQGIDFLVAQCNLAYTRRAGTVRGLHFQEAQAAEKKLVRCLAGQVFDVIVDMRRDSPTYRSVHSVPLDPINRLALFIPAGIAHGYQAVSDNTEFFYMTDQFYSPEHEKGVRFDDPSLAIAWPLPPKNVTERDKRWPLLEPLGS